MRTFALLVLLLAASPLLAQAKKYALLIGVNKYEHAEMNRPQPLEYAEADVSELAELLRASGYEVDLFIGPKATRKAVDEAIKGLSKKGNADGIVLVAVAGHGVQFEKDDDAFYCPYDTGVRLAVRDGKPVLDGGGKQIIEPDPTTLIRLTDIVGQFRQSPAGSRVLLADCCRNDPTTGRGRGVGSGIKTDLLPANTAVLLSCSQGQRAYEDKKWKHGAFFYHVLQGLREGKGTAATLNAYLEENVASDVAATLPHAESKQEPHPLINGKRLDLGIKELRGQAQTHLNWPAQKEYEEARSYGQGIGKNIDLRKAVDFEKQAAGLGHPIAKVLYAGSLRLGSFVQKDEDLAAKLEKDALPEIRRAATLNHPAAQTCLGRMYENGTEVQKDEKEAVKWYRKAVAQNYVPAQFNLGRMYDRGTGVEKDEKEAVKWYRKAAEENFAFAQYNLGWMYENGNGVEQDDKEAVKWYRKAAMQNDADAQYNLGKMYENGTGVEQDDKEAVKWYRKAALQNDADAHCALGFMYAEGRGVEQDHKEAVECYRKAVAQNHSLAQNNLGFMYEKGRGVEQDEKEAVKWYRKAAAQNLALAQFNLGDMYERGSGVEKNKSEAVKWYRKAAAQKDPDALAALERLKM